MNRALLTEIVKEQHQNWQQLAAGTVRDRLPKIEDVMDLPHVIAIAGIRRCGKSTLMLQALKKYLTDKAYYFDFEDERLIDFGLDDFNLLYEIFLELFGKRHIFLFDEIQIIPNWERYVRRMYKGGHKFILTGSSADLLSSELGTKLTGRHILIELLPFSFTEYLRFTNSRIDLSGEILTKERGLLKKAYNHYSVSGGIPEYLQYKSDLILKNIYENILYKDVIVRYEIKAVKAIRELALWLLSNPGALLSYDKLKTMLRLGSVNTVKNYIHYLENAYLIFTVDKYAYSVADQTRSQKKVYAIDTGFLEVLGFQSSKNSGKYLENIVYLELRRRLQELDTLYYYKTQNDWEVDFCVRRNRKIIQLIQVCESFATEKTREREIRALFTAMTEQKLSEGVLVMLDHAEVIKEKGKTIRCVPVVEWLVQRAE